MQRFFAAVTPPAPLRKTSRRRLFFPNFKRIVAGAQKFAAAAKNPRYFAAGASSPNAA
ncbi:MAG: hypothetical protein LUD52_00350 [Opitutae bacterium]|nr:hypothetical protein [Opitutae bacterium]